MLHEQSVVHQTERGLLEDHLVQHDSKRVHVGFERVLVMRKPLRTSVGKSEAVLDF